MGVRGGYLDARFIDMKLWQEIVFLKNFSKCQFVIENVEPYYHPFIIPDCKMQRHFFWSNFEIKPAKLDKIDVIIKQVSANDTVFGFSLKGRNLKHRKDQILRNCVNPDLGLYILEQAKGVIREQNVKQNLLFN